MQDAHTRFESNSGHLGVWSRTKDSWNWNARYRFLLALRKMGTGWSGQLLPRITLGVPDSVLTGLVRTNIGSLIEHPVPALKEWCVAAAAQAMSILLSANMNPYRAFRFHESLVRYHIPKCLVWDSKRDAQAHIDTDTDTHAHAHTHPQLAGASRIEF